MDSSPHHRSSASATLSLTNRPSEPDSTSGSDSAGETEGEPPSRGPHASPTRGLSATGIGIPSHGQPMAESPWSLQPNSWPVPPATSESATTAAAAPAAPLDDPLARSMGWAAGVVIALLTAFVPLASVLQDRAGAPGRAELPTVPSTGSLHGPQQPAGIPLSRSGEPAGGDPRRKPQ